MTTKQKIEGYQGDLRKLHALVTNLTTKPVDVKCPKHTSKQQLAEDFVTFFETNIQNIRELLKNKPKFIPDNNDVPRLKRFATITEKQVCRVIGSLKNKSCKLDQIPTDILKKMLPVVAPIITRIVNLSLSEGQFCRS